MMGRWSRAAALLAGLFLFGAACTPIIGQNTNNAGSVSSPSAPASPSSTSTGTTTAPPSPSPIASPSPTASLLAITGLPLHNGEVGIGYLAVTFLAGGGIPPYSWSVSAGAFPPGLSLSSGGVVTGKNTTAGHFGFTVKVADAGGQAATSTASMTVFAALGATALCAQVCNVGVTCTTCGRFGKVTGGAGPYQYKVVGGAVPTGMTLNGFAVNGPFPPPAVSTLPVDVVGPPARFVYSLAVEVTDDFGATATVTANWLLFGPVHMNCTVDFQCTSVTNAVPDTDITYSLGAPSDSVTVKVVKVCNANQVCVTDAAGIAAALPPNWSATAKGGTVTVYADCANSCPFYADVYIVLVDHGACVAPAYVQSPDTIVNVDV